MTATRLSGLWLQVLSMVSQLDRHKWVTKEQRV